MRFHSFCSLSSSSSSFVFVFKALLLFWVLALSCTAHFYYTHNLTVALAPAAFIKRDSAGQKERERESPCVEGKEGRFGQEQPASQPPICSVLLESPPPSPSSRKSHTKLELFLRKGGVLRDGFEVGMRIEHRDGSYCDAVDDQEVGEFVRMMVRVCWWCYIWCWMIFLLCQSVSGARPLLHSSPSGVSKIGKDGHSSQASVDTSPIDKNQKMDKGAGELSFQIGSRPPSCSNKCNSCFPCQAVQVPTPIDHRVASQGPLPSSSSSAGQICSEYSNYKPEGWKCKCGSKLFNP